MASTAEYVRIAIKAIEEMEIDTFTSKDILEWIGEKNARQFRVKPKTVGTALANMVVAGELYRLDQLKKNPDGGRGLTVYTRSIKQKAKDDDPTYKEPEKAPEEPTLNYAQIGRGIMARMHELKNSIHELSTMLKDCNTQSIQQQETIAAQNKTISSLNLEVKELKRKPKYHCDNGKFKLSEIAKVK